MQGQKQYSEKLFLSFQLSQRVPDDNFYRRLSKNLDLQFLYKLTKLYYGNEGQQSIDPVVFFKLMLFGYVENINSDRKIIEQASIRLDILFFIGYDIDEALPWHSTLSRTRKLLGDDVFLSVFRQVLDLCVRSGMVSGRRQAIDSAYIKANASLDSIKEKKVIEKETSSFLQMLDNDDNDNSKPTVTVEKKKQVESHHAWKKKAYKTMPGNRVSEAERVDESGNPIRAKFLSNHTHYSSTDPDARISVKPGKPRQFNYSGQISVDTKSHVICGAIADLADRRDSQSLPAILLNTLFNLAPYKIKVDELLADTGYSSGNSLKALDGLNITPYIPNFGGYKPQREGFTYDPINDEYICSQGVKITYKKTFFDKKGNHKKQYRSSTLHCKKCPIMKQCLGACKEKKIEHTADREYYDRMHERMQTPKARRMMRLRSSTVEPVLGTLVNFLNMKRVNTRGISLAHRHVLLAATAYNLKKYMNYCQKRSKGALAKYLDNIPNVCKPLFSLISEAIYHFNLYFEVLFSFLQIFSKKVKLSFF